MGHFIPDSLLCSIRYLQKIPPDKGIPGGRGFTEELRDCQCDEYCAEEAQDWAGCLGGQERVVSRAPCPLCHLLPSPLEAQEECNSL